MKMGKVLPYFLALVVTLQVYQMYKIHGIQQIGVHRTSDADIMNLRYRPGRVLQSSPSRSNQEQQEEAFSACLMIMDDNAHLIEWLAYHYLRLPLRRLIVAVDPRSQTSPSEILRRWEGLMDITEWSDVDFMPPTMMDRHLNVPDNDHKALTKLFRQRQEEFYTRCMALLKYEGRSWTAFVDTDEYILLNVHAQDPYNALIKSTSTTTSKQPSSSGSTTTKTIIQGIQRAQEENGFLAKEFFNSPCVSLHRLAFGVKESTSNEIQKQVPFGFDGRDFQTMRWRWHAGRGSKKVNKISKSILDVSRVDSELFIPTEQVMVHLPSKAWCHGGKAQAVGKFAEGTNEDHLRPLNLRSPIVVHHYAATWEQWSHRKDTRGKRTRENYEKLMYETKTDDEIRPWLQDFVNLMGFWTARTLLREVGKIPALA